MFAVNPAAEAATPKACPSCGKRYPADALFCSFDGAPLTTTPGAVAAAAATDVYVGREISGHIEIRQLVGIGAMGRVYRAFQNGIDRDVAVKILHRELSANPALVSRFHREAKVASRLAHPNVVHVILTGQLPDGAMYIVMEYLDGLSLQSALAAAGGAMPLPRALHVALQLCDAAGEAHVQGVVHRDLKPENVMLVKRAEDPDYVKVLDFGIARLNWGEQSMATAAGLIFGTARYISPEGAQGEKVGPQGDVYAIATMVYQMLAGRTPFDADQAVALLVQQIHDAPRPLRSIERAAYVPEPIAAVVMQNLSKKPEERAESARAFGRALLEAAVESGLSAQDILARPAMMPGARGSSPSVVQLPSVQRTRQLQLSPDDATRMTPPSPSATPPPPPPREGEAGRTTRTAYLTPAPEATGRAGHTQLRTEIPEVESLPPGVATTKWHPSPELEARMAPAAPSVSPVPHVPHVPHVPLPPPSGVDLTMDDQQVGLGIARTVAGTTPPPSVAAPSSSSSSSSSVASVVAPPPSSADALARANGNAATAPPSVVPLPAARPSFASDTRLADERADIAAGQASAQTRPVALVATVFLLAAALTALVASRAGMIGGGRRGEATAHVSPSSSVPVASVEPVPIEPAASLAAGNAGALPPLVGRGAPSLAGAGGAGSAAAASARATVDTSSARPAVGTPVDLVGRLGGTHARVESPHFRITGPGLSGGTDVSAVDDGAGAYRATFTFLQGGRFEVDFLAKADGTLTRAGRTLVVGGAAPPTGPATPPGDGPPPAAAGPAAPAGPAAAAPSASAKWM